MTHGVPTAVGARYIFLSRALPRGRRPARGGGRGRRLLV